MGDIVIKVWETRLSFFRKHTCSAICSEFRLLIQGLCVQSHTFIEINHGIFSKVILLLPLIQEGLLSVTSKSMCNLLSLKLAQEKSGLVTFYPAQACNQTHFFPVQACNQTHFFPVQACNLSRHDHYCCHTKHKKCIPPPPHLWHWKFDIVLFWNSDQILSAHQHWSDTIHHGRRKVQFC